LIEFAEHHLLIALAAMIVIQALAVVNGKRYGGVVFSFLAATLIGAGVFWALLIFLPQVI